MKMEHTITAPAGGTISSLPVAVGEKVDAGRELIVIDLDDHTNPHTDPGASD